MRPNWGHVSSSVVFTCCQTGHRLQLSNRRAEIYNTHLPRRIGHAWLADELSCSRYVYISLSVRARTLACADVHLNTQTSAHHRYRPRKDLLHRPEESCSDHKGCTRAGYSANDGCTPLIGVESVSDSQEWCDEVGERIRSTRSC